MRKDVLIARITFIILCLAIVGVIVSVAGRISASKKGNQEKDPVKKESEVSEVVDSTEPVVESEIVEPEEPVVVYVKTTKSVNLRSAANTEADVLKVLEADEKLELVAENDGWAEVVSGDTNGFVSMDFLEYVSDDETPEVDPVTGGSSSTVLKVTTDNVRMRAGAGTDADILMTIEPGVTLEILEEVDGWAKVNYQGKTGYVSCDYIQ